MDELLRDFLTETCETIDRVDAELVRFEQDPGNDQILGAIFRLVHTIKGTCGFIGLSRLERLTHAAESAIGAFREGRPVTQEAVGQILATIDRIKLILHHLELKQCEPDGDDAELVRGLLASSGETDTHTVSSEPPPLPVLVEPFPTETMAELPPPVAGEASAATISARTIRVAVDTIERLMTTVSELVLTRNQLMDIARRQDDSDYKLPLQRLSTVTAELQESVMKTRMQPIAGLWQKLPRLVRDLSAELGKDIEIEFAGGETELDRQVLELIKDPLTHLVRNAADHGIETPEVRRLRGKPPRGTIRLSAHHEGGTISLEIEDDGRGLDIAGIRAKVLREGLASEAELDRMGEAMIARFIFHPGFSTARTVSHVSGRGVGMDVVRNNVEEIGGSVDLRWVPGQGTAFSIKIPLTLAIVAALIVESGGQRFAIPQTSVVELVRVRPGSDQRIEIINGRSLLRLRDKLLPIGHLGELLDLDPGGDARRGSKGFIVVMKVGRIHFGLAVQGVFHTEEIVVKPMSARLRQIGVFSGTTILGDGAVILILDPNGIASQIGHSAAVVADEHETPSAHELRGPKATPLLVFRAGGGDPKAVPLALVTRLEEVDVAAIEQVGGRRMLQYRGELIPIIPADPQVKLREAGIQPLLIITDGQLCMGLAVDDIVDIVEEPLEVSLTTDRPGLVGSAVVRGRATGVLDIGHFLPLAHPDWRRKSAGSSTGPARDQRPRALLVEASPFYRGLLVPMLDAAGYDVTEAVDRRQALGLLAEGGHYAIVACDLDGEDAAGLDLVETMAAQRGGPDTRAVGLSARPIASIIARARSLGFASVASKFDRHAIGEAVRAADPNYGAAA
jgi:two-component system chemotaxis sensor kinase CheA